MITYEEIEEVRRHVNRADDFKGRISAATDGQEIRDAWEDFLGAFGRAIGKMISLARLHPTSRPWGHKLWNSSNEDDLGLMYLREARNSVEHGLNPVVDVQEAQVELGPFFRGSNGTVSVIGCDVNGIPVDGSVEVRNGSVQYLQGNVPVKEHPADVVLQVVHNPAKKRRVEPPNLIYGRPLATGTVTELTSAGNQILAELFREFEVLAKA